MTMTMKKLNLILLALVCMMAGCDSINFDPAINEDDDAVTKSNTESLMAGAMRSYFTGGQGRATLYMQYQSAYVYTDASRYSVNQGGWSGWYNTMLKNLDEISDVMSSDNPGAVNLTFGAPENQIGVSKIFASIIWKRVTDAFGPAPYEEALTDSIITPAYSAQEVIYKGIISDLQAARDMLDPSKPGPTGDVTYGGDIVSWQKFANSQLMALALQMSNVYPDAGGYAAQVFNEALNHPAGIIDEVAEEMWYDFTSLSGTQNPLSNVRRPDFSMSRPIATAMKGTAPSKGTFTNPSFSSDTPDPRWDLYADRADSAGRYYGVQNADSLSDSHFAAISLDVSDAPSDLAFMTAAYTFLNRAEAAVLGWTSEDATAMLTQGIVLSFKSLDQHYMGDDIGEEDYDLASQGAAFATARVADVANASGGILQVIREEKWVSLFPRSSQAWSEWRRTGVPGLIPSPDPLNADGQIPRRNIYPQNEAGTNVEAYNAGVALLAPAEDTYKARFWWDEQQ